MFLFVGDDYFGLGSELVEAVGAVGGLGVAVEEGRTGL